MDLFPTLVDLAGIPKALECPKVMDSSNINACTEGKSLAPIVRGWKYGNILVEDDGALVQAKRPGHIMGYSLVTKEYR